MKEQIIEEIENTLITISENPIMIEGLEHWADVIAEALYNAGYRKQKEGEWKQAYNNYPRYVCTNCNHLYNNKGYKYCPNCGAKMKGGAE